MQRHTETLGPDVQTFIFEARTLISKIGVSFWDVGTLPSLEGVENHLLVWTATFFAADEHVPVSVDGHLQKEAHAGGQLLMWVSCAFVSLL